MVDVDFRVVDEKLSANLFNLLMDIFLFSCSPKYKKSSFVSKFAVAKIFSEYNNPNGRVRNPNGQVRFAVDCCVRWKLLYYSSDDKLYFDFDAFETFFRSTSRGKKMFSVVEEFYIITY